MRYNSFDKFGVNIYEKGNLIRRKIFSSLLMNYRKGDINHERT